MFRPETPKMSLATTEGYEDRRPRTWATLTDAGHGALVREMDALRELLNQFEQSDPFTH